MWLTAALHFAEDVGGRGAAIDCFLLLARWQLAWLFLFRCARFAPLEELPNSAATFFFGGWGAVSSFAIGKLRDIFHCCRVTGHRDTIHRRAGFFGTHRASFFERVGNV